MAKKKQADQMVERWDLKAVSMTEPKEIQDSLETGYEPFSVSNLMKKQESSLVSAGQNGGLVMETLVWLKRKVLVPVLTDASADNVTPLNSST